MSTTNSPISIEHNIVYGMVSGAALLGDLYRPDQANGLGLIHISGSGWHAPTTYDAQPLKESGHVEIYVRPLAAQGFTLFTINHRAAPRFRYPAAIEDAQRAVRHLRYHAEQYGIQADRIGAIGGSSGGNLVSLLGVLAGTGKPEADDPIEREGANVQCVVARAAPTDLTRMPGETLASYLGRRLEQPPETDTLYQAASPLSHVAPNSPPFLLIHGTADEVVPLEQSLLMKEALEAQAVPAHLMTVEGGGHGPHFPGAIEPPDLIPEIAAWFQRHLAAGTDNPRRLKSHLKS